MMTRRFDSARGTSEALGSPPPLAPMLDEHLLPISATAKNTRTSFLLISSKGTRVLCCGYSFLAVIASGVAITLMIFSSSGGGAAAALWSTLPREQPASPGGVEIALVNLIRHAERGADKSDPGLTADGKLRAMYLAQCIGGATEPTLAFPLGPPTALLASERFFPDYSTRPHDTLRPIQESLQLSAGIELMPSLDFESVEQRVQELTPGETLLVAWQHDFVPSLVSLLRPPTPVVVDTFPFECNLSYYQEPEYTRSTLPGASSCYDVIWQVMLQRPKKEQQRRQLGLKEEEKEEEEARQEPWRAVSFAQLHQGFAGKAHDTCREALAPISMSNGGLASGGSSLFAGRRSLFRSWWRAK